MGKIEYDVPLIEQQENEICWVACAAMVASERLGYSIGIGHYIHGLDPSSSSINDPGNGYYDKVSRMGLWGFECVSIDATNDEIENVLRSCGPFVLWHYSAGFPYGHGHRLRTDPYKAHAVVITGFDASINGGTCWMNNPWGDKDRPLLSSAVIDALNKFQTDGTGAVFYYRQS